MQRRSTRRKEADLERAAWAGGVDVFATQRFRIRAGDDTVIPFTERASTSRALHLTVQSTFGRPPRLRQRPQEPQQGSPSPFGGGS